MTTRLLLLYLLLGLCVVVDAQSTAQLLASKGCTNTCRYIRGANGLTGPVGATGPPGIQGPAGTNATMIGATGLQGEIGPAGLNGYVDHVVFAEQRSNRMPGRYYGVLTAAEYRSMNTLLSVQPSWFVLNEGKDRFGLAGIAGGTTYHISITATQQSVTTNSVMYLRLAVMDVTTGQLISYAANGPGSVVSAIGTTMVATLETQVVITEDTFYSVRQFTSQTLGYMGTAIPVAMTDALSVNVYMTARVQNIRSTDLQTYSITDTTTVVPFTSVAVVASFTLSTAAIAPVITSHSSMFHFRSQQVAGTISDSTRIWSTLGGSYAVYYCHHFTGTTTGSVLVWIKINSIDAPNSLLQGVLSSANRVGSLCGSVVVTLLPSDFIEVFASGSVTTVSLPSVVATTGAPVGPALSLVATATTDTTSLLSSTTALSIASASFVPVVFQSGSSTLIDADRITLIGTGLMVVTYSLTVAGTAGVLVESWLASSTSNASPLANSAARWTIRDTQTVLIQTIVDLSADVVLMARATGTASTSHLAVSLVPPRPFSPGATLIVTPVSTAYHQAYSSSTLTLAVAATAQRVLFATTVFSSGFTMTNLGGTFSPSTSGAWRIAVVLILTGTNNNNVCDMHLRKGLLGAATTVASVLENSGMTTTLINNADTRTLSRTYVVNLAATDLIEVYWKCGSIATIPFTAAATGAPSSAGARITMNRISTDTPHSQVAAAGPSW